MIKISSNINQKKFHHRKEKFRFQSNRSFQESNNPNWRATENHQEASSVTKPYFTDISFFRGTPSPSDTDPPPPPPAAASSGPVLTSTSVSSSVLNQTFQAETTLTKPEWDSTSLESPKIIPQLQDLKPPATCTPLNPFRCSRRQIEFPRTPNLVYSLSAQVPATESLVPVSFSSTSIALDLSSPTTSDIDDAGMEAFKNVMKAVFEKKHF